MTGDPVLALGQRSRWGSDTRAGSGPSRNRRVAGSLMATPWASRRPAHDDRCQDAGSRSVHPEAGEGSAESAPTTSSRASKNHDRRRHHPIGRADVARRWPPLTVSGLATWSAEAGGWWRAAATDGSSTDESVLPVTGLRDAPPAARSSVRRRHTRRRCEGDGGGDRHIEPAAAPHTRLPHAFAGSRPLPRAQPRRVVTRHRHRS
jgi:hypothetical protein